MYRLVFYMLFKNKCNNSNLSIQSLYIGYLIICDVIIMSFVHQIVCYLFPSVGDGIDQKLNRWIKMVYH